MKAVSLFSGVGGFELGFERAGISTVLQAERDPWALQVLERHWPETERVTDVRTVGMGHGSGDEHCEPTEPITGDRADAQSRWSGVDLVYGGFPCQDLSVAGKRAGLGGERSGLWFEFHRVLRELRPRWAVIENVPGLLSSNGGRDFGVILDGLDELGFDVAWAVLDAQHFGVPQRRRRVFVVAGPRGRGAEQVLSICESCGGNPETGRTAGQDLAGTLGAGSADSQRGWRGDLDSSGAYITSMTGGGVARAGDTRGQDPLVVSPTLTGGAEGRGFRGDDGSNAYVVANAISASAGHHGHSSPRVAATLRGRSHGEGVNMPGRGGEEAYGDNLIAYSLNARDGKGINAGHGPNNLVAYPISTSNAARTSQREADTTFVVAHALTSEVYHHGGIPNQTANGDNGYMQADAVGVRRLTPLECERLMGWPDDHTRWAADEREISDSHRYRMCGNGVVAPVAEWIGHRLVAVDALMRIGVMTSMNR